MSCYRRWALLTNFLYCSTLEGSASQVSEQGLRKALYQKIVAAFPEGWMSSGQVSREGELVCRAISYINLIYSG
jgi:Ubinuclein conserved middle domain